MVMIPKSRCPICDQPKNQYVDHSRCAKQMQAKFADHNARRAELLKTNPQAVYGARWRA